MLSWDSFVAWGLLAWFVALTITEALLEKRELRTASNDGMTSSRIEVVRNVSIEGCDSVAFGRV